MTRPNPTRNAKSADGAATSRSGRALTGTLLLVTGLAAMLAAGGCQTGNTGANSGPTATQAPSATSSASSSPNLVTAGLRGERQFVGTCTAPLENGQLPPEGALRAIIEPVLRYRACHAASFPGRQPDFVEVTTADQPTFDQLGAALAPADEHATSDVVCLGRGIIPRQVLAQTRSGWWSVHIPTNVCHGYQHVVYGLLTSITDPT